jgi:hypothetical protein
MINTRINKCCLYVTGTGNRSERRCLILIIYFYFASNMERSPVNNFARNLGSDPRKNDTAPAVYAAPAAPE